MRLPWRRAAIVWVLGGIVVALQAADLAFVWHVIWPLSARDCAESPRWCDDDTFALVMFGGLPQLFFSAITLPFLSWFVADMVVRFADRRKRRTDTV